MKNVTVYLDEQYRTPGIDHLDQYRNSCFYNLLMKSAKERGNAFEDIAAKVLRASGYDAEVATASYGDYDLIVDGVKYELKASRKASQYDSRGRSYQFSHIKDNNRADSLMLMNLRPDDVVEIYTTTFARIKDKLNTMHKDEQGNPCVFQLSKNPSDVDADLLVSVQMA